jgi:uncharacterized membrane protein YjfL (UPF0719 family)
MQPLWFLLYLSSKIIELISVPEGATLFLIPPARPRRNTSPGTESKNTSVQENLKRENIWENTFNLRVCTFGCEVSTMDAVNAFIGIIQLIIAIIFAVIALYIGFSVFGRITKGIDEEKEIQRGNVAIGILMASVFIGIAIVVQSGVAGLSTGIATALNVGILSLAGIAAIIAAIIQLILGIALAVGAIYLALHILDRLTKGINEFQEIQKGNVAVALEMGGVIIATSVIIQSGIIGITGALI